MLVTSCYLISFVFSIELGADMKGCYYSELFPEWYRIQSKSMIWVFFFSSFIRVRLQKHTC